MDLQCAVQTYAWGKCGLESEVAKLMKAGNVSFKVDDSVPYAELWMGTHPKGPALVTSLNQSLSDWIEQHPEGLGSEFSKVFTTVGELPFLFKVLSVNIALSIQVHPNKADAERLHAEFPSVYPDSNHKPEMAIALTPFEALCGFRPIPEIVQFLQDVPELRNLIGEQRIDSLSLCKESDNISQLQKEAALKECFSALMNSSEKSVADALNDLIKRISAERSSGKVVDGYLNELLLRLHDQFPGDVGCFCIYFLNFIKLDVGQAIFLQANLPHAYLSGDCLECMACSDNVVRAGLTPKFKDVSTLLAMLNYRPLSVEETLFKFKVNPPDPYVTVYDPPVKDFSVDKILIPTDIGEYTVSSINGASIIIVIHGEASGRTSHNSPVQFHRGSILFLAANESIKLSIVSKSQDLLMFRAYCVV